MSTNDLLTPLGRLARERLLTRFRPRPEYRPFGSDAGAALRIRWLGTAGHIIDDGTTTVLVDPFLSRPGFRELATQRLVSKEAAILAKLPPKVDAVLIGHSHFDHAQDAPFIAKYTGCLLAGSRTTCNWARAAGVPEAQLVEIPPTGRSFAVGAMTVRFVPSKHGKALFGRIPLPGEVNEIPRHFAGRIHEYKMGGAFGILLKTAAGTVYHNGSADLVDAELTGERADILLACLAGRQGTDRYLLRLATQLQPRLVVPSHHDAFFQPLDEGFFLLPGVDLDGFLNECRLHVPGAQVIAPTYADVIAVPEREGGRGGLAVVAR